MRFLKVRLIVLESVDRDLPRRPFTNLLALSSLDALPEWGYFLIDLPCMNFKKLLEGEQAIDLHSLKLMILHIDTCSALWVILDASPFIHKLFSKLGPLLILFDLLSLLYKLFLSSGVRNNDSWVIRFVPAAFLRTEEFSNGDFHRHV